MLKPNLRAIIWATTNEEKLYEFDELNFNWILMWSILSYDGRIRQVYQSFTK